MDISTLIGTLLGFGMVLFAMSSGDGGIVTFVHVPSLLLVVGDTLAVTRMNFPSSEMMSIAKVMAVTTIQRAATAGEEIERIVQYANLARKEGLLALENKLTEVQDRFFAKGVQLVIDGFGAETVRDIMSLEAEWQRQRH